MTVFCQEAITKQITSETKEEFSARVKAILLNYPKEKIDNIILSMDKRIEAVIKKRGQRTKYWEHYCMANDWAGYGISEQSSW